MTLHATTDELMRPSAHGYVWTHGRNFEFATESEQQYSHKQAKNAQLDDSCGFQNSWQSPDFQHLGTNMFQRCSD